jgi:hypothetical protein
MKYSHQFYISFLVGSHYGNEENDLKRSSDGNSDYKLVEIMGGKGIKTKL